MSMNINMMINGPLRWGWCLALLPFSSLGQTLDESLLEESTSRSRQSWNWSEGEPGEWSVWLDYDAGTIEQFQGTTRNNLLSVGSVGHPEWSNNKLTDAVERMGYSGFNGAVEWQGWYVPRQLRIGASKQIWKGIFAGLQAGKAWSPAYVECTRADGETVVASWTQVRFADFLDQYTYYDYLHDGNTWQYGNLGTFREGLSGWRIELVGHQELAFGLGWMASLGTTVGLQSDLEKKAASLFGSQGLVDPSELGPTLSPSTIAAVPNVATLGLTYRTGAVLMGISWSNVALTHGNRNTWVQAGAESMEPMKQARLRLGMTF